MKKILFIMGIIIILMVSVYGVSHISQKPKNDAHKISIITTLFPLYDFAKQIGQDKVEVSLLLPPGVEAHTFEPKPSDLLKINTTNIFVYTGKFMEPWAEDMIKGISKKNVKIVDASSGIQLIHEKTDNKNDTVDPHIWLDVDNDKIMIDSIAQALGEKDPANTNYYQNNAMTYKNVLTALDTKYKTTLSLCKNKEIVYGGHYAFGYLAKKYDLSYKSAYGVSPDSEPSAQDLATLIELIKKDAIQYVFFEELMSPKIAETLAKETGTQLLVLNPSHNVTKEEFENNITFVTIMENNLKNLSQGLQCP